MRRFRTACNSAQPRMVSQWLRFLPMNPSAPVNWYVRGADVVLAALCYVLIARLLLDLTLGALGDNAAFRALRSVTNPVVRAFGAITPRVVPGLLVTAGGIVWIFAARIVLAQVPTALSLWRMMG